MYKLLTTVFASVALAATPALAQTTQGQSSQGQTQTQATPQSQGGAQSGQHTMSSEQMAVSQQRVIQSLTQAGLKDVQIMDAAYLVQATTQEDEQIMMIVNSAGQPMSPPRMGQSNQSQTQQGSNQTPQNQGQSGGQTKSAN